MARRDDGEVSTRNPRCVEPTSGVKRVQKLATGERMDFTWWCFHPFPIVHHLRHIPCYRSCEIYGWMLAWHDSISFPNYKRACGSSLQFMVHGIISNYRKSISRMWSMNKVAKCLDWLQNWLCSANNGRTYGILNGLELELRVKRLVWLESVHQSVKIKQQT